MNEFIIAFVTIFFTQPAFSAQQKKYSKLENH